MKEFYPLKGFEDYYEISKDGEIFNKRTEKLLPKITFDGVISYSLLKNIKNWKYKQKDLHYLLAGTFIKNPKNLVYVVFKDGDKTNYNLDNLKWSKTPLKKLYPIPKSINGEKWYKCFNTDKYYINEKGDVFSRIHNKLVKPKNILNNVRNNYNGLKEIFYAIYNGHFDNKKYTVLQKNRDGQDLSKENLFLADIVGNTNWVQILLKNIRKNRKALVSKDRIEDSLKNIVDMEYIIKLYEEQDGLSYFLNIYLDTTMSDPITSPSLDRIDNDKGYTKDNVRLVTRFENFGRGASDYEDFKKFCKGFLKNCMRPNESMDY